MYEIANGKKSNGRAFARPLLPYILLSGLLALRILALPVCPGPVNICNRTVTPTDLTCLVSGCPTTSLLSLVLRLAHFLSAVKSACLTVPVSGTALS